MTLRRFDGSAPDARTAWWADMLARRTGETVWVGELLNDKVRVVHQAVRPDDVVQLLDVDSAVAWHASALGLAIVASLDPDIQEALLSRPAQRLTGLTVVEPGELRKALAVTRQRGYAVEAHAATLGEASIAAPVCGPSGLAIGAIGIVGPVERLLPAERQRGLAESVCSTAYALSHDAGADPARPTGQ